MTSRKKRIRRKRRKKEIERIKKLFIGHAMRALVILALAIMAVLMICGCLYIYEHVFQKSNVKEADAYYGALPSLEGGRADESGSSEEEVTVVLDAGHGGSDGGTEEGAATEKDINLAVAVQMKKLLEAEGIAVILTRDQDVYVDLDERVRTANQDQADLFLSLHCNYYDKDSSIRGLECYYAEGSESGRQLAEQIIRKMEEGNVVQARNAKPGNFHVLRGARIPAVLVEMGYLSNYAERKDLTSMDYQEKLAAELVNGIRGML